MSRPIINWHMKAIGAAPVVTSGYLRGWGQNDEYQVDNTGIEIFEPKLLIGPRVKCIAAWGDVSLKIHSSGKLLIRGDVDGYCGIGGSSADDWTQIGTDEDWIFVSVGPGVYTKYSFLAIKENGTLHAWGDDTQRKLGLGMREPFESGDNNPIEYPTLVGPYSDWTFCQVTRTASVGLRGHVLMFCGENVNGIFGDMWGPNEAFFGTRQDESEGVLTTYGEFCVSGYDNWKQASIFNDAGSIAEFCGVKNDAGGEGPVLEAGGFLGGKCVGWAFDTIGSANYGRASHCTYIDVQVDRPVKIAHNATENTVAFIRHTGTIMIHIEDPLATFTPPSTQTAVDPDDFTQCGSDTDWQDLWLHPTEQVLFARKENRTLWVYPYAEGSVDPEEGWSLLGLGEEGVAPYNVFTQIGEGANYRDLAIGDDHVLAVYDTPS